MYLETPNLDRLSRGAFQHWLWQVGVLQRAFPDSTLEMDDVVRTAHEHNIHDPLSCTELRGVALCLAPAPGGQAFATLGRLHGSRLQLQVPADAFPMLEAEPALAAHVSRAALPCFRSRNASSSWADQVSSLSGLTKLTLPNLVSMQGAGMLAEAGMLDALQQLSMLRSLCCLGDDMQTLLAHSVPLSWPLLTKLQLGLSARNLVDGRSAPDLSLVEQQCPQLQALAVHKATWLCLTALTSLTCPYWEPRDTDSFQCSQLVHLHVRTSANLNLLLSTLTSLSLDPMPRPFLAPANLQHQHLSSQQALVHISFTSHLMDLSDIQGLVPATRPLLAPSVASVELTMSLEAFHPPDLGGSMAEQHFHHLDAWFPHLQRLHVCLQHNFLHQPQQRLEEVLMSAAWLPAHCRLTVTHKLSRPVRIVKCLRTSVAACRSPCRHALLINERTPCNVRRTPSNMKCTLAPGSIGDAQRPSTELGSAEGISHSCRFSADNRLATTQLSRNKASATSKFGQVLHQH